jgi:hypothetical protein
LCYIFFEIFNSNPHQWKSMTLQNPRKKGKLKLKMIEGARDHVPPHQGEDVNIHLIVLNIIS